MKKKIIILLFFCIFLFVGCDLKSIKSNKLSGEYEIVAYGDYAKYLEEMSKIFCKNNPKVKINIKTLSEKEYLNATSQMAKTNNLKGDALILTGFQANKIININKEFLFNMTSFVDNNASNIYNWRKDECKFNGKYYGYPLDSRPVVMYYNKDIFSKYHIHDDDIITWDDFINYGKTIKGESKGKIHMLCTSELTKEEFISVLCNEIYLGEDSIKNEENKVDKIKNLLINFKTSDITTNNINDIKDIATIVASSKFYKKIKDNFNKINWGYMMLPAFDKGGNRFVTLEGVNIVLVNNNKNKYTLEQFIKFCTDDKVALLNSMFKYGIFPANIQCYKHTMIESREEVVGYRQLWQSFSNIVSNTNKVNSEKYIKNTSMDNFN